MKVLGLTLVCNSTETAHLRAGGTSKAVGLCPVCERQLLPTTQPPGPALGASRMFTILYLAGLIKEAL